MYLPLSGPGDCEGHFKAMWDSDNLYLLVDVTDDSLKNDGGDFWNNDGIEIFIDADNSKSKSYGDNDFQFHLVWDKNKPIIGEEKHQATQGVQFAMVTKQTSYCAEIKLPWSTLKVKASAGMMIGLDVHVNDDDDGGDRESKLAWYGKEDDAWENPKALGTAQLTDLVGWWKFEGNINDSAGSNNGTEHNGPTYGPGKDGQAISFDGVDDYVTVPDSPAIEFGNQSFSIALWLKSNWKADSEKEFIICNGTNGSEYTGASGKRYVVKFEENNFQFLIDDDKVKSTLNGPCEKFATGDWVHAVAVRDAEARELHMYRNGALESTETNIDTGDISSPGEPLFIGAKPQEYANAGSQSKAPIGHHFKGMIDELRLYDYALSQEEIKQIIAIKP
jgi:hypothetical protein